MKMDDGENYNVGSIDPVENAIRKFPQNRAPDIAVYDLILNRIIDNPFHGSIDLTDKLPTQSVLLLVVPPHSLP